MATEPGSEPRSIEPQVHVLFTAPERRVQMIVILVLALSLISFVILVCFYPLWVSISSPGREVLEKLTSSSLRAGTVSPGRGVLPGSRCDMNTYRMHAPIFYECPFSH